MRINIRESMVELLEKTIKKNDYMALVVIQLKIKNGYYENVPADKMKSEIKYLEQYKLSYPHIRKEIDEVIEYIESMDQNASEA